MTPALDLTRRHFHYVRGDITIIGSWIRNADDRFRPCLVLIRTGEEQNPYTVPCVITLDKAWIWSREVGDMMAAADTVAGFLIALRKTPTRQNIIRIASLVEDHIGDLLTIPPYLPQERHVVAELTITDEHGKTREVEITENV